MLAEFLAMAYPYAMALTAVILGVRWLRENRKRQRELELAKQKNLAPGEQL